MSEQSSPIHGSTAELVERSGAFFGDMGVPRAAGQMFGYLLVCDPPEQSAGQIARALGLSAASISSSARILVTVEAVEVRHRIGDRKTYYRLRSDFWLSATRSKLGAFDHLAALGRTVQRSGDVVALDRVDELVAFSEFWHEELPGMIERWEARKASMREGP